MSKKEKKPRSLPGNGSMHSKRFIRSLEAQASREEKESGKTILENPKVAHQSSASKFILEPAPVPPSGTRGEKPRCYKRGNKPFFKRAS